MTAYLLVENKGRELASRLLIAKALVDRGVQVAVGQRKALVLGLRGRSPGVVLEKGLNRIAGNAMRKLPEHTHAAIDEEAFGLATFAQANREHDIEAPVAEVYVNSHIADYREAYPGAALTGNPRADLCGMPSLWMGEARRIRKAYGAFVLVNTSAGGINSNWGSLHAYIDVLHKVGWVKNVGDIASHIRDDAVAMDLLVTFAIRAAERGLRVIVRPHPSENAETWKFLLGQDATILANGWHLPWLAAAQVTVHAGCTTGYEAALMGRPAIAIRTHRPVDAAFASNAINPAYSPEQAVNMAQDIIAGAPYEAMSPGLCDAHERIAEHLAAMDQGPADIEPFPDVDRNDYESAKMTATIEEVESLYRRMGGAGPVRQVGDSVFVVEPV